MSFPVLQRMERKRPELIQPINWKAEALKGLASGIESGIKIANTIQQIQTQRLENDRKKQESIVNIALAQETTRKLQLDNQEKERIAAIRKAYLDGVQVDQLNEIGLRMQADAAAYITGVSTIMKVSGVPTSSQAVGPIDTPAPKTFIEGLSSGYLPKLRAQAKETTNLMKDRAVSVADRFAAWDDVRGKAIPFSSAIDAYVAVGDPDSFVTAMSADFKPFVSKNTVTDAVNTMPMTIVVTEKNYKDLLSEIPKDEDGNPLAVAGLIASKYPVEVPLSKVIGGLGKGYYIDEVADEIKSADNPEPFIKYLEKRLAKKPEIMNQIKMKAGLIEDKVQDQRVNVSDDSLKLAEIPEAPVTETIMTPEGDYINVPTDLGIVSKIKNLKNKIEDGVAFRSMLSDIIKEAPDKPSMLKPGGIIPDTPENYAYLKRLRDDWIIEQNDLVDKLQSENEDDIFRRKIGVATELASWLNDKVSLMETKGFKMETSFERTKRLDAEIMSDNYDPYKGTTQTQTSKQLKAIVDTSGKDDSDDSMVTVRYKGRTLKIKRDDLDEALKAGAVLQK